MFYHGLVLAGSLVYCHPLPAVKKKLHSAELKHCNGEAQTYKKQPEISIKDIQSDSKLQGTKTVSTLMRGEILWGLKNNIFLCTTPRNVQILYISCKKLKIMPSYHTNMSSWFFAGSKTRKTPPKTETTLKIVQK